MVISKSHSLFDILIFCNPAPQSLSKGNFLAMQELRNWQDLAIKLTPLSNTPKLSRVYLSFAVCLELSPVMIRLKAIKQTRFELAVSIRPLAKSIGIEDTWEGKEQVDVNMLRIRLESTQFEVTVSIRHSNAEDSTSIASSMDSIDNNFQFFGMIN